MDFRRSYAGERVVSRKLNLRYDFETFTQRFAEHPDDPELLVAFEDLKVFERKSAMLTEVQDLHAENLVYTDEGWRAMDFLNMLTPYRGHSLLDFKAFEFLARMYDILPLYYQAGLRRGFERLPAEMRLALNEVIDRERDARSGLWHRVSASCVLLLRFVFTRTPRGA